MVEVLGYILVAVKIVALGDITGVALDYFADANTCVTHAIELEATAPLGVGYVCLEDFVELNDS